MNDYDVIVFRASALVLGVHPVEEGDASRRAVLGARKAAAAKGEVDDGQRLLEG
jgi:hypothetical protein